MRLDCKFCILLFPHIVPTTKRLVLTLGWGRVVSTEKSTREVGTEEHSTYNCEENENLRVEICEHRVNFAQPLFPLRRSSTLPSLMSFHHNLHWFSSLFNELLFPNRANYIQYNQFSTERQFTEMSSQKKTSIEYPSNTVHILYWYIFSKTGRDIVRVHVGVYHKLDIGTFRENCCIST